MIDKLQQILRDLTTHDPRVRGALVVSNDGLTMASTHEEVESTETAAITATIIDRTDRIFERTGLGQTEETVLVGDLSTYLMVRAGAEGNLIVQTDADSVLGLLQHRARQAAHKIAQTLEGSA